MFGKLIGSNNLLLWINFFEQTILVAKSNHFANQLIKSVILINYKLQIKSI